MFKIKDNEILKNVNSNNKMLLNEELQFKNHLENDNYTNDLFKWITLEDILKPDFEKYGFVNEEEYKEIKKNNESKILQAETNGRVINIILFITGILILIDYYSDTLFIIFMIVYIFLFNMTKLFFSTRLNIEKSKEVYSLENEIRRNTEVISMQNDIGFFKEAIEEEAKENNSVLPNQHEKIWNDIVLIIVMNYNKINHNIILKTIDELLIPNIKQYTYSDKGFTLMIALAFLNGAGVISEYEQNERDIYLNNFRKREKENIEVTKNS